MAYIHYWVNHMLISSWQLAKLNLGLGSGQTHLVSAASANTVLHCSIQPE